MKTFLVALIILTAASASAQQLIYVQPSQPQPSSPTAVVVPVPSADALVIVPMVPQPRSGIVTDQENRRFHYQETAPGAGSYWVYPLQTQD